MGTQNDIFELLHVFLKRSWLIALVTLIAVGISIGYSKYLITPEYESDTTLMVSTKKSYLATDIAECFDVTAISANQKLVITYCEIVKSRIVLEQVNRQLNLGMSYTKLLSHVHAQPVGNTEILKITVSSSNPEQAAIIANTISDIFVKEVMRILNVDNVEKIDEAIPIQQPVNVRPLRNLAIGLFSGIALGLFMAFVLEVLDTTLRKPEDVVLHLGIPVLGVIPNFKHVK